MVDILALAKSGLDTIWVEASTYLVPVTYIRVTRSPYAPGGRVVNTETQHPINRIMLADYDLQMNPRTDIAVSDKNAIIRAKDLPFNPSVGDRIVEADGTEWSVQALGGDTRVYHDLQVRKR